MQWSTFKSLSLFVVGGLAALALSGCGTSSQDSASSSSGPHTQAEAQTDDTSTADDSTTDTSNSAGKAVFSYEDTTYSAELTYCALRGGEEALFHGAAKDESGNQVGYLDGDFGGLSDIPYGEVRINFGAAAQFESTDDFAAMGDAASHIVITDSSDTSLIVMGGAWAQDGTKFPTATLRVTC